MNNREKFELLKLQVTQQDFLTVEKELEKSNIHVIQLNDKDIPKGHKAKKDSRSITSQLRLWINTLSEEEKDHNLFFGGIDEAFEKFRDYVLNKYKGKKGLEWEIKFQDEQYVEDVKKLMMSRIYDHKAKRESFVSGDAYNHYQVNLLLKNSRKFSHESVGRMKKVLESKGDYTFSEKELQMLIIESIESVLNRELPSFLPKKQNNKFLN